MAREAEPSPLSFVDNRFGSATRVRPEFEQQLSSDFLAIRLVVDGDQGDGLDGEHWTHATVDIASTNSASTIRPGNVALKDWSENLGLPELMVKAGILTSENREIQGAPIFMLTPKALALAADAMEAPVAKKRGPRP